MWIEGRGHLPGRLIVISGPSGSGKSTLVRRLLDRGELNLQLSISATTRPPRPEEQEGVDYFFVPRDAMQGPHPRFGDGEYLERAEFNGNYYGTPAEPVFEAITRGRNVILEIEVQGATQIREKAPTATFLFIRTPMFEDLEKRLRSRGTETDASIHQRLVRARSELAEAHWYDAQIINDDLDRAVEELAHILTQHLRGGSASDA